MNKNLMISSLVVGVCIFVRINLSAGSLDPSGLPAPTMKTLGQVEPRTSISTLPYMITNSGSYYVTGNLVSSTSGIIITASGVKVDLMGFSLAGDASANDFGIHVAGTTNIMIDDLLIIDGRITGFYSGLLCQNMNNSRIEKLIVSENLSGGIIFNGADYSQSDGNSIIHCTIRGNGDSGIFLNGSYFGKCDHNTIANCVIRGNGSRGIYFYGYSGQCDGNSVVNCSISGNGYSGISLRGDYGKCNGNIITDCSISVNAGHGIQFSGVLGQCNGNTIRENTISKNIAAGISLGDADGNRIEANHVWRTGTTHVGINTVSSEKNFILKNTCVGYLNNFSLSYDDTYGPEVIDAGSLTPSGESSHPWANFSR